MAETIVAISTALGEGGIGIVRVSGPASLDIMRLLYKECPKSSLEEMAEIKPRYAYYGHVISPKNNETRVIDEAVFLYMKAPASYTGEDMLEIQAHGSNIALRDIVSACIEAGRQLAKSDDRVRVRMAEAGEFTKLAFLNGKMDLSQAEAVIDIIKAKTELGLGIAEGQRQGRISQAVEMCRDELREILAQMAVNIDYPDEDIEQETYEEYIEKLRFVLDSLEKLIASASIGRIAREGIKIAIVGKPNVGKSSLMNALLGEGRAIVTDVPGTTRDTVEESANIEGYPIVLVDTAGIRETTDVVEKIGIERTHNALAAADIIICVIDGSQPLDEEDLAVLSKIRESGKSKVIVVLNKEDKGLVIKKEEILDEIKGGNIVSTSLLGLGALEGTSKISSAILDKFASLKPDMTEGNIVSNERHIVALQNAADNIEQAMYMLEEAEPLEVTELNLHYAYDELGLIIGEAVGDEILDTVFSKFCLGK